MHPSRHVLITGGSSDIGRAIAIELASPGSQIVLQYYKNKEHTDHTLSLLEKKDCQGLAVAADLGNESEIRALFKTIRNQFGPLDILVNNAARRLDGPLISMSVAKWDEVLNVVARGAFLCTREALVDMTRKRFGRIVNICSVAALSGWAGQANYASAKAALIGLTRVTAREYGKYGITCNAIAPGLIETSGVADVQGQRREDILSKAIIQRAGTPEEVGAAVAFLCSKTSGFITGQVLPVDGGFSL